MQWYARSLAPSIGIDPEGLTERLSRRFTQLLGAQSAPAMTPERFAGERERLQQQERENQLSAIRVNMANASIRRAADSRLWIVLVWWLLTVCRYRYIERGSEDDVASLGWGVGESEGMAGLDMGNGIHTESGSTFEFLMRNASNLLLGQCQTQ